MYIRDANSIRGYYTYFVEPSLIDPTFSEKVTNILRNSGWNSAYTLAPAPKESATIHIKLVDRATMIAENPPKDKHADGSPIYFSFTRQSPTMRPEVWIDANNWQYGVNESKLSTSEYQKYVINHEVGHALGVDHVGCDINAGGVCPVMWQSTRGCGAARCGTDVSNADIKGPLINFRYRI